MTYPLSKEIDYLKIETEFNATQDYRGFIFKYYQLQDAQVSILVVKANWQLVLSEKDEQQIKKGLSHFVWKNKENEDGEVRGLIVQALFKLLKLEEEEMSAHKYLEQCNQIIEYAYGIEECGEDIYRALAFVYWFKAELIRDVDWRKSQYFYNKVVELSKKIEGDEHFTLKIKAQMAKITLHLQHENFKEVEKLFYGMLKRYEDNQHAIVIDVLDELIHRYIQYLINESEWFHQAERSKTLLVYLIEHPKIQKIILTSNLYERSVPRLLWISYIYWGVKQEILHEQYLLRYFSFLSNWEDVVIGIKEELLFDTKQDGLDFLGYAEDLYKRYVNLSKYRKLFGQKNEL